jgi:ribosomal protein S18 acetylase RimI-like enzyme
LEELRMTDAQPGAGANSLQSEAITIRPGTPDDTYNVFLVFRETLPQLLQMQGEDGSTVTDPQAMAQAWEEEESIYRHLAATADEFWIAEQAGRAVGYARSIVRDNHRELTEFFVLPSVQSAGLGKALLARAFPPEPSGRSIIATPNVRAQALYLRAGVYPRFAFYYMSITPRPLSVAGDLRIEPVSGTAAALDTLDAIDQAVIGYRRREEHRWLMTNRAAYLYLRGDRPVGFGYVGGQSGPFALLDPADFPAVLTQAEASCAEQGQDHFGLFVPTVNCHAIDHLLAHGFRIGRFVPTYLDSGQPGRFDCYIGTSPPFVI